MKSFNNKGFAIINALVFSLVLIILGAAIAYITQIGFFSISAEARYQIAEKNANKGLLKTINALYNGSKICSGTENYSFSLGNALVKLISDEDDRNCFIWAKGIFKNSKVIKIAIISPFNNYWGAAVFRKLNSLYIGKCADITSCNETCKTPALITGNNMTLNSTFTNGSCSSYKDIRAWVDEPYKIRPELLNSPAYLTNTVFKNAKNRNDIFNILSQKYGISFNNGTPVGITDQNVWNGTNLNNCTAEGTTLNCTYINGSDITLNYNSTTGKFILGSNEYDAVNLGDTPLTINSFEGGVGAKIVAGNVTFTGKGEVSNIILVARKKINISNRCNCGKRCNCGNFTTILNSSLFTKDYDIHDCHFYYEGGILYSSGNGYLKLRCRSTIGTADNPTLIIADNQLDINGRCWTEINGLVYITEGNSNFGLDMDEKGRFEVHGAVISNSLTNFLTMRCRTTIEFRPDILKKLSSKLDFIKPPICNVSSKNQLITTKMRIY